MKLAGAKDEGMKGEGRSKNTQLKLGIGEAFSLVGLATFFFLFFFLLFNLLLPTYDRGVRERQSGMGSKHTR